MTPKYKINKDWRKRHPSTWQKGKSRYYKKSEEKAHNGRQCWTIQDIDLITNKNGKTDTEIAGLIGRSVKAIQIMRCRTNIIDHKHYRKGGTTMRLTINKECTIHVGENKINITTYHNYKTSILINTYLPVNMNSITLTEGEALTLAALLIQTVDKNIPQPLTQGKYQ